MEPFYIQTTICNNEVIEYIRKETSKGEALDNVMEKLLSIGVAVIERIHSSRDVEFVKKETEKMITEFNNRVTSLETAIQTNVEAQISKYFNPDFDDSYSKKFANYLRSHLTNFHQISKGLLDDARQISGEKMGAIENGIKAAEKNFNPDLETSYFGKIKKIITGVEDGINKQLDDKYCDSFAARLKNDAISLFGDNSPILKSMEKIMERYTDDFKSQFEVLKKMVAKEEGKQEGLSEMIEKTSLKGSNFEEIVLDRLEKMAQPFNDIVEYIGNTPEIGGSSKKGDYFYSLKEGIKILIEAKDDNQGLKPSLDYLNNAMTSRGCSFGILVKKHDSQTPKQAGIFGFYHDNKIITSLTYLEFAIRWARIFLTKAENKNVVGINQTLVLQRVNDVMSKLKEFSNIKTNLSKIRNATITNSDSITLVLDTIKSDIENYLQEIELEIRTCNDLNDNTSSIAA